MIQLYNDCAYPSIKFRPSLNSIPVRQEIICYICIIYVCIYMCILLFKNHYVLVMQFMILSVAYSRKHF